MGLAIFRLAWYIERMDTRLLNARLYGIVDIGYVRPTDVVSCASELIEGGVRILQLRAKSLTREEVAPLAREMCALCREKGALFVLNDYPELAAHAGADAVHVGQDADTLADVRRIVGPRMLIGRSTHSLEQVRRARDEGADYIGYGPLFPTATKPGRPAIGLRGIARAQQLAGEMPVFCIGGINEATLPRVLAAGAQRVVVVSWLLQQADRARAARELLRTLSPA